MLSTCKHQKINETTLIKYYNTKYKLDYDKCLSEFAECVIEELCDLTKEYNSRTNFSIFIKYTLPIIKEELYKEFKDIISDTDFDLYMRKAVLFYEN